MKENEEKLKHGDEIVRARIANEDMPEWIQTLRKGDFTEQEIDMILSNLNAYEAKPRKIK